MRKGCSVSGWIVLLVLLSLFAGFYYLGGIKSRQERDVLTREAQFAQEAYIHYCLILEQQNMIIAQQDSMISASRQEVMEYSWLYQKAVRGELATRRKFDAYKDSIAAARPTQQLWWFTDDGRLPWKNIDPGIIEYDSITLPSWWK